MQRQTERFPYGMVIYTLAKYTDPHTDFLLGVPVFLKTNCVPVHRYLDVIILLLLHKYAIGSSAIMTWSGARITKTSV